MDRGLVSILVLGISFMFIFTAFQTMCNIEKTVLSSITHESNDFSGDGYVSLAIIYGSFAICNWIAPSVVTLIGPRSTMLIGSLTYCAFTASFLIPRTWLLYVSSALLGLGAALMWNGQGVYLSRASSLTTISRNSAIFWAMLQGSMLMGNAFVWHEFSGKTEVDATTRCFLITTLVAVALLGVFILLTLPSHSVSQQAAHPLAIMKGALELLITPHMVFLSFTFFYTGLELSFFSGVYSPSVGFTKSLGAKHLVGLSGICVGLGEVLGGVVCGIIGPKWRRDGIVLIGYVAHAVAFVCALINLPDKAVFGDTDTISLLVPPSISIALLAAFLLGFGDACFNTQIIAMLASVFAAQSADAFALFRFVQSFGASMSFAYSTVLGLRVQLAILAVAGALGTLAFWRIEWRTKIFNVNIEDMEKKRLPSAED
ncbi:UNC93-like protein MFSD11 isoform X2 [Phlebotomus argentipes]|uniref:UNC93-like protein MFSD11 isoform X2 n=1 Tax=Phlebotomus argentipes TaxID=94469 RepID=UPI0028934EF5|nr:UNC93-like protein MFSD11 isoform X2 [Phlebotomus argentipes]